jgi:hypothetical protein
MSRTLPIHWQRLVSPEGQTCPRCASTGDEVKRAVKILEQALPPLGIQPELQITEMDTSTFRANPAESNRITIADRTVEDWLGGRTGGSRCCSVCGDSNCRTVEVAGGSPHESPRPATLDTALVPPLPAFRPTASHGLAARREASVIESIAFSVKSENAANPRRHKTLSTRSRARCVNRAPRATQD